MKHLLLPTLLFFTFACSKQSKPEVVTTKDPSQNWVATQVKPALHDYDLKPVFGYRFHITGDFDGDGKQETLTERYTSNLTGKEVCKYVDTDYGLMDYGVLVDITVTREPHSFLLSSNSKIDTLTIRSGGQIFGISFLKNEGDLNGDGGDELSYVGDWADWSNCNSWHVMTYDKKQGWRELYSFDIRDWQLPPLPQAVNDYGLFGTTGKVIVPETDSVNRLLEKQLKDWPGLVKKLSGNKAKVYYITAEADQDSVIVNMKTGKNISPIKDLEWLEKTYQ